jgi:hypothetical protein
MIAPHRIIAWRATILGGILCVVGCSPQESDPIANGRMEATQQGGQDAAKPVANGPTMKMDRELPPRPVPPVGVKDFVARSSRGDAMYPGHFPRAKLRAEEAEKAGAYVRAHPDRSSYLLLWELSDDFPAAYARIPDGTKAAILCDQLAKAETCNDWGTPKYDSMSAKVLLATGRAALPYLKPLLDNRNVLYDQDGRMHFGGENQYRVADFAYRYVSLILGLDPTLDPDPGPQYEKNKQLKQKLESMKAE